MRLSFLEGVVNGRYVGVRGIVVHDSEVKETQFYQFTSQHTIQSDSGYSFRSVIRTIRFRVDLIVLADYRNSQTYTP